LLTIDLGKPLVERPSEFTIPLEFGLHELPQDSRVSISPQIAMIVAQFGLHEPHTLSNLISTFGNGTVKYVIRSVEATRRKPTSNKQCARGDVNRGCVA
jgi:hypothetical protein